MIRHCRHIRLLAVALVIIAAGGGCTQGDEVEAAADGTAGASDDSHPDFLRPGSEPTATVEFRLLFAGDDPTANAASNPIDGWLVANHLDSSVMVFDAAGTGLGSVTLAGWRNAPGQGPERTSIGNDQLRAVVDSLERLGPAELSAFLNRFETEEQATRGADATDMSSLETLVGRPAAVATAVIDVNLATTAADGGDPDPFDPAEPGFAIQLGRSGQPGNGLIGYWIGGATGDDDRFLPSSEPLRHSLTAPPVTVALLIDPRGSAFATAGLLPPAQVALPPEHMTDPLQAIVTHFLTAPNLTANTGLIQLDEERDLVDGWLDVEE